MLSIGAFAAKTHLSALLERVARGEEVLITRHGKAIARLVPADTVAPVDHAALVARLKAAREKADLGDLDWRALRDEGRR